MVLKQKISLLLLIFSFQLGCERIPDWELRPRDAETLKDWEALEALRPWLWTCRGRQTQYRVGEQHQLTQLLVDRFRDPFKASGLSLVEINSEKTLMGSAFLWNESGYLVTLWQWADQVSDVECKNFKTDWLPFQYLTKDQALNLALYQVQNPAELGVTKEDLWVKVSEEPRLNDEVFVVAASLDASLERMPVYPQIFSQNLQTGVDSSLILFQPSPPAIFKSGLLINSRSQVLGFLFQAAQEAWGASLRINEMSEVIDSLIHSGRFLRAYLGMRVQYEKDSGFTVKEIEVGGPAYRTGLRVQDKLLKWGEMELKALDDWPRLDTASVGKKVSIQYQRGGSLKEAELEISQF